ncbi:MAG: ribonuclease E/G [Acidimicrobiaceae bacterium]|nr:ribonuclease E/G [Acidimicrobiaceae bacterium]
METDKPTDSTDSTPVRRRRTISDTNTSTPTAADQGQPRNRTRKLPGTVKSPTQETNIRRKRKSERSKSKPQVGDSRPAAPIDAEVEATPKPGRQRRRRGNKGKGKSTQPRAADQTGKPVEAILEDQPVTLGKEQLERRRGRERKGRPVGRYQMLVHVHEGVTHIAVLEGRSLIEHYVSRPSDDVSEIHGNIYLGKVQNVLPGMEAAFVDIGTPKNAVLYRGDVTYDSEDLDGGKAQPSAPKAKNPRTRFGRTQNEARIEDLLSTRQSILCQVTKNPIAHKGARLSTEVSLPGRFVVLVPNSDTYGISKRLGDKERRRLRNILDKVKPAEHGVIVRTAAQDVTAEEIERDVRRLLEQWQQINALSSSTKAPNLLFREPELAVRVIREEFSRDYRGVVIDDPSLYQQVKGYMETVTPALADRIEFHDKEKEPLPLFERYHIAEQLRKAVDQKVWLPSGGSLVIDHTEALTVIDVNTGKNVGKSSLEETVFRNNLEAAEEIAKQLRLRDIGGIIVIDFIDMEIKKNRDEVVRAFEEALARDKTRTQVSGISDLGLVEMTRRRTGEGLLESLSNTCEHCDGRGVELHQSVLKI